MPLVFLPDSEALFLWGETPPPRALAGLTGESWTTRLVTPAGPVETTGQKLPLLAALSRLAGIPAAELTTLPGSVAVWSVASKLAVDLISRERVVPTVTRTGGRIEARWAAALSGGEDASRVSLVAQSMPAAAHAVPVNHPHAGPLIVWAPDALLRAFIDAVVDAMVRNARGGPELPARKSQAWTQRWQGALTGADRSFEPQGFGERSVVDDLARWSEPALGARDRLRASFRLELPEADGEAFALSFLLQSPDDLSLLVPASEVWSNQGRKLEKLGRAFRDPQESLLEALGRAARVYPPIAHALEEAAPEQIALDPAGAWTFLGDGAAALSDAGFGVIVPAELTAAGQRRLRLRMRVGGKARVSGVVAGAGGLGMDELLAVDWEAVIGDNTLSARELAALAQHKAPLVRYRGAWVAIDPGELKEIQARLKSGPSRISVREALQASLLGETKVAELSVAVSASGALTQLLDRLKGASALTSAAPSTLQATLRPYQERGLHWLVTMGSLGLGACLADDMGLGKTMQLLAALLQRLEHAPEDRRPALLVAPTSVVGNWEREIGRFAPALQIVRHYGTERARSAADFPSQAGALVLTTYGLLRRDSELLSQLDWSVAALDEAQNIKNAASATARAARALRASQRVALTGTPVENRLAELWSILEFANPGMLGPIERFRRDFAVPIERYANQDAAAKLRRVVSPFILRREKSDPNVIQDLPPKLEMKVVCTLTREQASLYKAVVDEELRRIEQAEGMERRGRVLALLTYSKQICNHPAHYLGERGPLLGRSGKLARVTEMLEEAIAAGDKALVFTQFREMGDKLAQHLAASLGCEILFLHGGTSKKARDEMVQRFQDEPHAARVFVLSVKAGGTGLNLTAASHVFHFDRWWNPAVEDQATDRAYRIGQTRNVQVHKLMCAGTVEEKIDKLLEHKRGLASSVVARGEQWITELDGGALRDLFALADGAVANDDLEETPAPKRARKRRSEARP
jgi:superfamily II DNA or RNA helicase